MKRALAIAVALGAVLAAGPAGAKEKAPVNGSWRILPIAMQGPRTVDIGATDTVLLSQPVVPEAVRTTPAAIAAGGQSLPAAATLFRATVKTQTLWCALEPARVLPEEKKKSAASAFLLGGRVTPPGGATVCFADTSGDGSLDTAYAAKTTPFPLPSIQSLGKAEAVAPFTAAEGDAAAVTGWTVELTAQMGGFKKDDRPIFNLFLRSPGGTSTLEGAWLVDPSNVSFAMYGNLALLAVKYDSAVPARISIETAAGRGTRITVGNSMEARGLTLGKPRF